VRQRNRGAVERGRRQPLERKGEGVVGGERGKRSGEVRASSNARVTRLVLSLVPKEACRVGHTSPSAIQLFLFFASVHSATPRHGNATTERTHPLILVPSYNGYLEVPSSHDMLHLHQPFHLPPPSAHLTHLPQICRNIDKIGGGDE
jgi:hypothetical protein